MPSFRTCGEVTTNSASMHVPDSRSPQHSTSSRWWSDRLASPRLVSPRLTIHQRNSAAVLKNLHNPSGRNGSADSSMNIAWSRDVDEVLGTHRVPARLVGGSWQGDL